MGNITSTITQPAGRTIFAFLRREVDGLYWNALDEAFQVLNLASADESTRAPFRIPYTDSSGTYTWALSTDTFMDGSYIYTARELSGITEYSGIAEVSFTVANGDASSVLTVGLAQSAGKTLFSFLRRNRDGLYYSYGDSSFGTADMASAAEDVRASYRIPFSEDPAGEYTWSLDVAGFQDGTYTVSSRELVGSLEILVGVDYPVSIYNGVVVTGVSLGEVKLNHNTGSTDSLRYVTAGGAPISGAKICVYAAGGDAEPIGVTFTDKYGRWEAPVLVPAGASYTIVFSKPSLYGPDSRTVVL